MRKGALAAFLLALSLAVADSQAAIAQQTQTATEDDPLPPDGSGEPQTDFLRPLNLIEISPQYRETTGSQRPLDTYRLKFRTDRKIPLTDQWTLGLRFDAPLVTRNPITPVNPNGDFIAGLGDIDAQAAITRTINERWAFGAGVRIYAPTGGGDFGSGKWEIMPGAAFRYGLPEISSGSYIEPDLRYAQSFAGDPNRRTINNLQFAPTVNFGLPHRWYLTLYPSNDIRWNLGDPIVGQSGRLFLPFDAKIGRRITDKISISLEAAAPIIQDYPVYKFKAILNFTATY